MGGFEGFGMNLGVPGPPPHLELAQQGVCALLQIGEVEAPLVILELLQGHRGNLGGLGEFGGPGGNLGAVGTLCR